MTAKQFLEIAVLHFLVILFVATHIFLVTCLSYTSSLKMDTVCVSETSVNVCRTTLDNIREEGTLYLRPWATTETQSVTW